MARHTTMPVRTQRTPFGDVKLSSRWMRDRYYLVASGSEAGIRWMFPSKVDRFEAIGRNFRHIFPPAPKPVTVERELRRICAAWQQAWDQRLAEHEDGIGDPGNPGQSHIETFGELFDHLYEERKDQVAKSTTSRDRYRLQLWREELGDDAVLEAVTPERISACLKRIGKRTSPTTANVALGVLKTYLNWAHHTGVIPHAQHKLVRRLPEQASGRSKRAWWSTTEVDLAIACARSDNHQPTALLLVAIGCYLGLRPEELIMLRWQDLQLDLRDPRTGRAKPICHITAHDDWKPKDGEDRDVPIPTPLLQILEDNRRSEGYLLQAQENKSGRPRGGTGWVYRYDPRKVWARIMKRVEAAGGRPITMYGMRHSFASNLLIAGVSDVKVARWLGHSDTRMVHRHYGHLLSYDEDIDAITRGRSNLRIVENDDDGVAGA